MDDPDAMKAVGKIWVHWLQYWHKLMPDNVVEGKTDLEKLVMADLHLLMDDTRMSSKDMHLTQN